MEVEAVEKKPRLFMRRRIRIQGKNKGSCVSCNEYVYWRSLDNRCKSCEIEDARNRVPLLIDRDILLALKNILE